jgi:membrane-associated protease RseP (regulator of RpoE activity)
MSGTDRTDGTAPPPAATAVDAATGPRRHRVRTKTPLDFAARLIAAEPRRTLVPALLFLATVASTLYVGRAFVDAYAAEVLVDMSPTGTILDGWPYALPLMLILLCHEMGHYLAARVHGVPVTLPYFIPIPFFFGTFGAVIRTRGRIRSRNALMDVGAAGPLAGMIVAVPCMVLGLHLSAVQPLPEGPYQLEGQSLLYLLLKRLVLGPIPAGSDVFLHPLAWAAWIGFLVTMINLIPVGQLDGGHVGFALLGRWHDTLSRWAHRILVVLGVLVGGAYGTRALVAGQPGLEVAAEYATG